MEENWKLDFLGDPFVVFHAKLNKVKVALAKWSKIAFGNIFQKVATLEEEIKVKEIQMEINPIVDNRLGMNNAYAELRKYWNHEKEF